MSKGRASRIDREYSKEVLVHAREQLKRWNKIQADKKKAEKKRLAEIKRLEAKIKKLEKKKK